MNAAKLHKSERLKRVISVLKKTRKWITTRDIIERANVVAVSACVSELRQHGLKISCVRRGDVWWYRLS